MSARKYHLAHLAALILLAVIFVSIMVSSNVLLRGVRFDLTQQKLWTLTEGSRSIIAKIDEPIALRFFFSRRLAQQYPSLRAHGQRVRELLSEVALISDGKIQIEYIEPEAFSEDEDRALALGLRPVSAASEQLLYFGLAGANRVDGVETIPFFSLAREHHLEYDLISLIRALAQRTKPMLGIVTSLPLDTGAGGMAAAQAGEARPFLIYRQLLGHFKLEFLEQEFSEVPARINVLMVAHPKRLSVETLYAIDQFVMRGGRVLAFVDPFSEISQKTWRGQKLRGLARSSNLAPLLKSWGVQFDPNDIVADRTLAQSVAVRDPLRARAESVVTRDYVLWLAANRAAGALAQDEVTTGDLSLINLATSGHFMPVVGREKNFHPLITSSDDAMLVSPRFIKERSTPDDLLAAFKPTGRSYVLAVRLSGDFASAFAGKPKRSRKKNRRFSFVPDGSHIGKTQKSANIILVADSDLFEDRFWARREVYSDQEIATPFADNSVFLINVMDHLMDAQELISLRGRKKQDRPFTHVNNLRAQASKKLSEKEYQLREKINALEQRLAKMDDGLSAQSSGGGGGGGGGDARESVTELRRDLLASRRSLLDVRRALNQRIERLGLWVRFFNIVFVPLILLLAFLLWPWMRSRVGARTSTTTGRRENLR